MGLLRTFAQTILEKTGKQAIPYPDRAELLSALQYNAEVAQKTLTGVGTALDVPLPFDPAWAILINETAGPTVFFGTSIKAAGTGVSIILATALVASNGFTFVPSPDAGVTPAKLTLGTGLQTTADVLRLIVFGAGSSPLVP